MLVYYFAKLNQLNEWTHVSTSFVVLKGVKWQVGGKFGYREGKRGWCKLPGLEEWPHQLEPKCVCVCVWNLHHSDKLVQQLHVKKHLNFQQWCIDLEEKEYLLTCKIISHAK